MTRMTAAQAGVEIDAITEFEELAETGEDAPTALFVDLD
jgi:glyoxylate carboligase